MKHVYRFDVSDRKKVDAEARVVDAEAFSDEEARCMTAVIRALAEDMPEACGNDFAPNGDYTTIDLRFDAGKCWILLRSRQAHAHEFAVDVDDGLVKVAVEVGKACGVISERSSQ